jgi:hypothetical protein
LKRPSLDLAVAFNHSIRESDEWFDEPDDLDRVGAALQAAGSIEDSIGVAATVAYRVACAQVSRNETSERPYSWPNGPST